MPDSSYNALRLMRWFPQLQGVLSVAELMRLANVRQDEFTYAVLMKVHADRGDVEATLALVEEMVCRPSKNSRVSENTVGCGVT